MLEISVKREVEGLAIGKVDEAHIEHGDNPQQRYRPHHANLKEDRPLEEDGKHKVAHNEACSYPHHYRKN